MIKAHITAYTIWFELDLLTFKRILELDDDALCASPTGKQLYEIIGELSAFEKGRYHEVKYDPHFGHGIEVIIDVSEARDRRTGDLHLQDAISEIKGVILEYIGHEEEA